MVDDAQLSDDTPHESPHARLEEFLARYRAEHPDLVANQEQLDAMLDELNRDLLRKAEAMRAKLPDEAPGVVQWGEGKKSNQAK